MRVMLSVLRGTRVAFDAMRKAKTKSTNRNGRRDVDARSASAVSKIRREGLLTVSLRIPVPMLNEIDSALKQRPYKMPRHMWLLEAIHEKLMRSRQAGSKHAEDGISDA
jgi:hypothetical protein